MARVASRCAALLAQRRSLSAAVTVAEESAKKVGEKAVKLGTVAKDIAAPWRPRRRRRRRSGSRTRTPATTGR
ncbi:hypothetical protein HU200_024776 [Digitaria exilis]|uniref:Uncharacterized protein n=1 Tax=Digitaria exilis TaxID=1010633 RepID=A0A835EWA5_9POAL|nr:hypothetical protein HU200_024776 [Digitaria exilis]